MTRTPSYRLHRASGQAIVTLSGRTIYLGEHNTRDSREAYDRVVGEWLERGRKPEPTPSAPTTIDNVAAAFWRHAREYYKGSQHVENVKLALRPLRRMFASLPAASFGVRHLRDVRQSMVDGGSLARRTINDRLQIVRQMVRWAESVELVPRGSWEHLRTLEPLKFGRCSARETDGVQPVAMKDVRATLPHLRGPVRAIVELLMHTGCRVSEALNATRRQISAEGELMVLRPDQHKNRHRGHGREIVLGPKAQRALKPFLSVLDPDAPLFRPADAEAERRAEGRRKRKTPVQPSQRRRAARAKGRRFADRYTPRTLRQAIHRACRKARVSPWNPGQIRHTVGTELRRKHGLEVAAAVLGHSKIETTQLYAERSEQIARETARRIG